MEIAADCKSVTHEVNIGGSNPSSPTICLFCGRELESKNYKIKFCNLSCAASFNNKGRKLSDNTKNKIGKSVSVWKNNNKILHIYKCEKCGDDFKLSRKIRFGRKIHCNKCIRKCFHKQDMGNLTSILQLSSRTVSKIMKRLGFGCSACGWNKAICDIHHIISRKKGGSDSHSNLTYVCPNCHRELENGLDVPYVTLDIQIGQKWIDAYKF